MQGKKKKKKAKQAFILKCEAKSEVGLSLKAACIFRCTGSQNKLRLT